MTATTDIAPDIATLFPAWKAGTANVLGFDRAPADCRVVVAMSGGVDSSATAALLHDLGFEVIGITLQLYDHGAAIEKTNTCCAGRDIHDARRVAERLGIPHYVLDYESRFREEVMEEFADSYLAGETPIPCVRCNQTVKFRDLVKAAKDLGADCLATGHYVRSVEGPDGRELKNAIDAGRDQSYFLFATTPEQLEFLRFPLGGLTKPEVRELAAHYDLAVADKPDSQDICFVPQGKYTDVIEKLRPGAAEPGEIVSLSGDVLGTHDGIIHFTIGQRRGIGLGGGDGTGDPLFVVKLEPDTRRVIVGPKEALLTQAIIMREMNWLSGDIPLGGLEVGVKIRSTKPPVAARIFSNDSDSARIVFDAPEAGVSPGQAAVCYADERVLGGGWIAATERLQQTEAA